MALLLLFVQIEIEREREKKRRKRETENKSSHIKSIKPKSLYNKRKISFSSPECLRSIKNAARKKIYKFRGIQYTEESTYPTS